MEFSQLLKDSVEKKASDIFIMPGLALSVKVDGVIKAVNAEMLKPDDTMRIISEAYELAKRSSDNLAQKGDDDFSVSLPGVSRFRICSFMQRGSWAAVIRIVPFDIPSFKEFNIPESVMAISQKTKGLVLVTGPAGGGKSTTLACVIDRINKERNGHIITLEEPIEYLHRNGKSIITQREVRADTEGYVTALRAALRQSPDVILVGEMRDYETISTALTAAETGHLVISTLHSIGAANTVNRIIDAFPSSQQKQIRVQLAQLLQSVVSQKLLPAKESRGGLVPAFEIMHCNTAIRNMIRENKVHQIDTVINASCESTGMIGMDAAILSMYKSGLITKETVFAFAETPELIERKLKEG
ncbi:MAG: PilT/PilU family type 4a pilus ATPase [Oscillospiraceae bacterium]|nr:PilT/PilU family type 4a pilus ATPase [Oscillospiraceae bacterium]